MRNLLTSASPKRAGPGKARPRNQPLRSNVTALLQLHAGTVKEGVNQEEADSIKAQLEEAGAGVELK